MDTEQLLTDEETMDPDVWAAREFVREITGVIDAELLPGIGSANFCPIAVSLGFYCHNSDFDHQEFVANPRLYSEANGGGSFLWQVDSTTVLHPGGLTIEEITGDEPRNALELSLALDEADRLGYVMDDNDCELRKFTVVPDDAWGSGAGTVPGFISRFDGGEFPSLHLDYEEV